MTANHWTLIDADRDVFVDDFDAKADGFQARHHVLRGGLREGVSVLRVASGEFAVDVLPSRGMGLWKAWLNGQEFGWRSPVRGPVHPKFVPLAEPSGLGWLDGFDELLVRCGLESNGAPEFGDEGRLRFPLHGRIGNWPAHTLQLTLDGDQLTVRGVVEETRFHFQKLRLTSTLTLRRGEARSHSTRSGRSGPRSVGRSSPSQ